MNPFNGHESANPILSDIELHRARVFDALSRHSDPVLREIGRQLAAGTVTPRALLSEPRYVEALQRGAEGVSAREPADDPGLPRRDPGLPRRDQGGRGALDGTG